MANWQKIKTEYITTDTSYRKLGEKYGIHYKVISDKGKAENWVELRSQHRDKTLTNALDAISKKKVNREARIQEVADQLLDATESLIKKSIIDGTSTLCSQSLKHLSGVLKDIKDIHMIRSEADMREQEAKIAVLRKQAEKEDDGKEVVVEMTEEVVEYSG